MNWEVIKNIYKRVLVFKCIFEYLGEDKYSLTSHYSTDEKKFRREYKNKILNGKEIYWLKDGTKVYEDHYSNGDHCF